jgi:hypothetical protein
MTKTQTSKSTTAKAVGAESVFKPTAATAMSTFDRVRIVFIAPSKHGVRLIVNRGKATNDVVYTFPDVVAMAGAKAGDTASLLAEKRVRDGVTYWNVTAIAVVE